MEDRDFLKSKIFLVLLSVLLISISLFFYLVNKEKQRKEDLLLIERNREALKIKKLIQKENDLRKLREELGGDILRADSVLVQDLETKDILYKKKYKKKQPVASLTKIATALIALEDKNLRDINIKRDDLYQEGEYFLKVGEYFSKEDIITFMLVISSNDAARAISSNLSEKPQEFIEKMNSLALKLGLDSTFFFSDTGLDVTNSVGGSYSSTEDINTLMVYFYDKYPELAERTAQAEVKICSNIVCHQIENTNKLFLTRDDILFSKTGYTNLAGGSLAMIVKIYNRMYSIVVLNSTKNGRFEDANKIIEVLYQILKKDIN